MNYLIISISLLISTIGSVLVLKRKNNKLFSRLSAFALNIIILGGATWILYRVDDEIRLFGVIHSEYYMLILVIPIITWINLLILQFFENRK
ncbi:hypothetical protein J14TS2_52530 [Bacillus sp. J14TS2]|uniref:hypothetical protein n=1 Tax=Bacillus sp. J14TS2 TaxID=2807188 RepID=UPI001AFED122|nr:hypothetical protein [Bacillus sp. J14TS2]GIN74778.1 hypothetical protein J14TS2_52530 [Bacillus sp. J14TS2]